MEIGRAWTPDARTADRGRRQGDERHGRRLDILDRQGEVTARWATNLARVAASAALGNP